MERVKSITDVDMKKPNLDHQSLKVAVFQDVMQGWGGGAGVATVLRGRGALASKE